MTFSSFSFYVVHWCLNLGYWCVCFQPLPCYYAYSLIDPFFPIYCINGLTMLAPKDSSEWSVVRQLLLSSSSHSVQELAKVVFFYRNWMILGNGQPFRLNQIVIFPALYTRVIVATIVCSYVSTNIVSLLFLMLSSFVITALWFGFAISS